MQDRTATEDDRDLAHEGYRPQLRRRLGGFAVFAAGFSYLSILTGIVQNFHLGYREAGPAFIWTWPIVFAGQFMIAVCFAGLAHEYPFCGGVYAWSGRTGSAFLGWLTGWVYLASLIVTLAAVALAWQITLPAVWPGFQLVQEPTRNAAILGAILITISTALNAVGTRWLAAVMKIGVIVELVAAVLLIVLLGVYAVRGPGATFEIQAGPTDEFGAFGPFLAAAVTAAYVMYGFDTAGTLAEETIHPRRRAPRAILQALVAAALLGMLLLITAVTGAPDLTDPRIGSELGGLPFLIKQILGETLGIVFVGASVCAIFVCTLAVQASTARILFAMARDRAILGWSWLDRIHPVHRSPRAAALVVGILSCSLLVFNLNSEQMMTALVCVSIVWANLAYLLTTGQLLARCLRRRPQSPPSFLGRWSVPVAGIAVAWGVVLIIDIGWPRVRLYGTKWYEQFAAPLFTAGLLVMGVIVYRIVKPTLVRREELR